MRLAHLQTGTKILGAFAVVSLAIVIISIVALWRMHAADALTNDLVNDKLARQQLTAELRVDIIKGIPLGRLGDAADVANACLFLVSDLSTYLTGITLDVNGGMLIH